MTRCAEAAVTTTSTEVSMTTCLTAALAPTRQLVGPGNDRLLGEAGNAPTLNAVDGVRTNDSVDGGSGTNGCTADPGDAVTRCS